MFKAPNLLAPICVLISLLGLPAFPSAAAELFGVHLFGQKSTGKAGDLRYSTEMILESEAAELQPVLLQNSLLVSESKRGASDRFTLIARARADHEQLTAVMYAEARYGVRIEITIDGVDLNDAAVERMPDAEGREIPVVIRVSPGPRFRFGKVGISQTRSTPGPQVMRPEDYNLISGQPARSEVIVAAIDQLVEHWRSKGYPLARVASKNVAADHARHEVDITISIEPGPPAVYGWVSVVGAKDFDSNTIAEQSAITTGKQFDPEDLRKSRERLRKLEGIESVRITEGESVDANGGIPITLEVSERKPRYIGGAASVSTLDGAEVSAYWGHRNLFGEGESLRVEGSIMRLGAEAFEDLEFDAGAIFEKPGIYDIDTKLFAEFRLARDNPDPYDAHSARMQVGISHKFTPTTTGSIAIEAEQTRIEDAFGTRDHTLLSTPADINYDARDNRLDPTGGLHAIARFTPVADVAEADAFLATDFHFAAYQAAEPGDWLVLAARVGVGSVAGASLSDVPASYRFFAGGGGSVRGYEYRSLGPVVDGQLAGGLSYVSASAELRWRISQQFGLVPFIDVATVSKSAAPRFSETIYLGAGLGVRYYTALGPLRFDLAVPLTERDGRSKFGIYVGLGQAF